LYPELIRIGPVTVYSYGVMIALAVLVALFLTYRQAPREGIQPSVTIDFILAVVVAGLAGSRIVYVVVHWGDYAFRPWAILGLGAAGELQGLSIHGGLLGGLLAGYWLARRWKLKFWRLADLCARPLAFGMGVGRVGCTLAGCCFGQLTGAGWGTTTVYAPGLRHPSQLYETALLWIVFGFLTWLMARERAPGQLFAAFLSGYGIARLLAEIYRDSARIALGLSLGQWVSVGLILAGAVLWRARSGRDPAPPASGAGPAINP
jgi:phosphatidylglycerol:prolipoprotein diacylglycerol transferase